MKRFRMWWAMVSRNARLKLANRIVRPLGATTVGGEVLLEAVKKLAELDSYIEKSGEIQHRKHVYAQLTSRLRVVGQIIEAAVRVGDPGTRAQQLVQTYMQTRWLSMGKNQQRKYQKAAAAQAMTNLPARPPTRVTA